jgi:Helicase associated domain
VSGIDDDEDIEGSSNRSDWRPKGGPTEKQNQRWQQKYQQMIQYQDENDGSSYPPKGTPLRTWADRQRKLYNNKKGKRILPEREEKLNEINFQWKKER